MGPDKMIFDTIIKDGTCIIENKEGILSHIVTDIGIKNGKIKELGISPSSKAKTTFSAKGLHVLPGLIDTQVHFREPGQTHKEDFFTGTKGAILGGITSVFDMPNNSPSITDKKSYLNKLKLAQKKCWCDYAFFIGATNRNANDLTELENLTACSGIKVFMGSSTGDLLVSDSLALETILKNLKRRAAFHSEDEARLRERKSLLNVKNPSVHLHPEWRDAETALKSTQKLMALSEKYKSPIHILHVTTKEEILHFKNHKKPWMSAECTPQHLTLSAPDCYEKYGTLTQMNPPIRDIKHKEALWKGVREGLIDVIGSDHAPHTKEEKEKPYPKSPSGLTGVQTTLPLMLDHISRGHMSLIRFVELMSKNPAKLYNIRNKGSICLENDADFTLVDLNKKKEITSSWIASKSGWTVFDKWKVRGWPIATMIRGHFVMKEDEVLGEPLGEQLSFNHYFSK